MSLLLRLIVLCLAFSVVGCRLATLELAYDITVRNAHADLPLAAEFAALYPNTEEAITYFTEEHGKPVWRSEVVIYERYCLSMHFPIARFRHHELIPLERESQSFSWQKWSPWSRGRMARRMSPTERHKSYLACRNGTPS